jgi:pilus assembly protein FimV
MWMVGAGAGILVLLLGLLMFLRRRQSIAEFEESILSGSALDSYSETTDTAGTSASDTSFLSDFGTAGMGTMQADEVDPLAEAEVYLAYGRDEQAEEVLKEAARRDPDRAEVKLKLLEIYKQRKDVKSFETIAEELYPAGDQGDHDTWNKVTRMGRELSPDNPLFQDAAVGESTINTENTSPSLQTHDTVSGTDFSLDGSLEPEPGQSATPSQPRQETRSQPGLGTSFDDLDLDTGRTSASATQDGTLNLGDDFLQTASGNVDPATQPFPTPDQQTDLDAELERLAGERETVVTGLEKAARPAAGGAGGRDRPAPGGESSRDLTWDKADSNSDTLDFPSSDSSEIEFDLNLDDSSIERLTESDAGDRKQDEAITLESELDSDGLMEFESDNIPPEETWAGPSTDASPGEESVAYSPDDDVRSAGAPQYNEAETKLDLARAYLDMGDKVGARSIIDEVMREGDPAQRDQAAELASQL